MERYRHLIDALEAAALGGAGELDVTTRRAAADPSSKTVPDDVAWYVDKVRNEAHTVGDRDIDRLRAAGYTDDQIFELTVATALGAGLSRLEALRRAMEPSETN